MRRIIVMLSLLFVSVVTACADQPIATSVTEPGINEFTITATGAGWEAAETAVEGWTRITLANRSDFMRQAAFLRLDDDKTMDDVMAAIAAGMEAIPSWMTSYGGVSGVMPGETKAVTANLPAGQYIVIDPVPEPDGVPGMAKGYFMPMQIIASDVPTAAPVSDMAVELVDYGFKFESDAVQAGQYTLHVTNSGPQEAHEVVIIKLDEGAATEDFIMAMGPDAPPGPPPGQIVAGTAAFDTEAENYVEVEFEAGATYAMVCFTASSVYEGQPHFMQGMVMQFEVPG